MHVNDQCEGFEGDFICSEHDCLKAMLSDTRRSTSRVSLFNTRSRPQPSDSKNKLF